MKVFFEVGDSRAELGNNGITFSVFENDGKTRVGRLRIGQAKIEWCEKNGKMGSGRKMNLRTLIEDHLRK